MAGRLVTSGGLWKVSLRGPSRVFPLGTKPAKMSGLKLHRARAIQLLGPGPNLARFRRSPAEFRLLLGELDRLGRVVLKCG